MSNSLVKETESVFKNIIEILNSKDLVYNLIEHDPTFNSNESYNQVKETTGNKRVGGKALVLKVDQAFKLFILNSSLKLNQNKIKAYFKIKRLRFATPEELFELTGLVPGCVPPFGQPILSLDIYADPSVLDNDKISFNAGLLTHSVVMNTSDWFEISKPTLFQFAE